MLYDYTCRKCSHTFDAIVTTRTANDVRCPECESDDLERLLGLPGPGRVAAPATNCRGDGPPCGAPRCGRRA
jgi:putative FmdB family regulatory protein